MKRTNLAFMTILAVFALAMTMADPFEGSSWSVKVTPDEDSRAAGAKEFQDVLSFKGSKLTSQMLEKQGFKAAMYEEDVTRIGPAKFTSQQTSDTAGTAKWAGVITSPAISGTLVWTKKDGKVMNYTFTGERVAR